MCQWQVDLIHQVLPVPGRTSRSRSADPASKQVSQCLAEVRAGGQVSTGSNGIQRSGPTSSLMRDVEVFSGLQAVEGDQPVADPQAGFELDPVVRQTEKCGSRERNSS